MHKLKQLINLSQELGRKTDHIQGAGGNTSVKSGDRMIIKASGYRLGEMRDKYGYISCNYKDIPDHLRSVSPRGTNSDKILNDLINKRQIVDESYGVASIETAMHTLLSSTYVAHTHNVYMNVFSCMENGIDIISEVINCDFLYVPYANPGFYLAQLLQKLMVNKKEIPNVIILENHGLMVHHEDPLKLLMLLDDISHRASEYLGKRGIALFNVRETVFSENHHLFPDTIVFENITLASLSSTKRREYNEIMSAHQYIKGAIMQLGAEPRFIAEKHVEYIGEMDKEKMRRKMMYQND